MCYRVRKEMADGLVEGDVVCGLALDGVVLSWAARNVQDSSGRDVQVNDGSSFRTVPTPTRIAECIARRLLFPISIKIL